MPDNQRGSRKTEEDIAFNAVVGKNIKYLRNCKQYNQTKVASHCNVKFQQLQKYEKGTNGTTAFRLNQLAKFFGVSMEVLVDPEMIIKHRGFTDDKTKRVLEIAKTIDDADRQRRAYRDEFIKENTNVDN